MATTDRRLKNVQPSANPQAILQNQIPKTPVRDAPTGNAPGQLTQNQSVVNSLLPNSAAILPSQRAAQIASAESPLNRQAETRAMQYAQGRGLLNSSIAAGAAQEAILDRAIPLAQADTSTQLEQQRMQLDQEERVFRRGLDQQRLQKDEAYRRDALAQQRALDSARISLDRGRLNLDSSISRGRLAIDRGMAAAQAAKMLADTKLARDQYTSDKAYKEALAKNEAERNRLLGERQTQIAKIEDARSQLESDQLTHTKDIDLKRWAVDKQYREDQMALMQKTQEEQNKLAVAHLELSKQGLTLQSKNSYMGALNDINNRLRQRIAEIYAMGLTDQTKVNNLVDAAQNQAAEERKAAEELYGQT